MKRVNLYIVTVDLMSPPTS